MKQIQKIGLFLALIIFLSSCGSLSITRMRYNRGLNIDWFSGKEDAAKATVKKEKAKKEPVQIAKEEEQTEPEQTSYAYEESTESGSEVSASEAIENYVPSPEMPKAKEAKRVKKTTSKIAAKTPARSSSVVGKVKSSFTSLSHKAESNETNDSDVNLILLVILCFILPPLAVYLYFGELNAHFWISLILILLFGGFYGSIGFGFGGLALLHALLVVFGIFG